MTQKAFSKIRVLIIAVAVIVIVGSVLVWQYWTRSAEQEQPADETANWQTYRNEEYYELMYPAAV